MYVTLNIVQSEAHHGGSFFQPYFQTEYKHHVHVKQLEQSTCSTFCFICLLAHPFVCFCSVMMTL